MPIQGLYILSLLWLATGYTVFRIIGQHYSCFGGSSNHSFAFKSVHFEPALNQGHAIDIPIRQHMNPIAVGDG